MLRVFLGTQGVGRIPGTSDNAAASADHFAQAYHALRSDPSVQFNYPPPVKPPEPPHWLQAFFRWLDDTLAPVGHFLAWLGSFLPGGPFAQILLWTVIALAAAALAWAVFSRIRYGSWRPRLRRPAEWASAEVEEDWAPEQSQARSWLEEADALAEQGRFAEAIHHLLFRSIEDIRRRRPAAVRPALTSRELAASESVPVKARGLFAGIAGLVERSLFGGRDVDQGDWQQARGAYSNFALSEAWRG